MITKFRLLFFFGASIVPFLALMAQNYSLVDSKFLITVLPFFILNIIGLYIISFLLHIRLSWDKSISLAILSLYLFYYFADIREALAHLFPLVDGIYKKALLFSVYILIYLIFSAIKGRLALLFLIFFTIFSIVSNTVILLFYEKEVPARSYNTFSENGMNGIGSNIVFQEKPNVYVITVDGYGREDMLFKYLNYKNDLIPYLEQNGYTVIKNSHSNYPITFLSLASTFTSSYLFDQGYHPFGRAPLYEIIGGKNPISSIFQENGYLLLHGEGGGHDVANCSNPHSICIKKSLFDLNSFGHNFIEKRISPELLGVILNKTPLYFLHNYFTSHIIVTIDQIIENLHRIREEHPLKPIYLYAYTIPPHPPFIFNADCSLKRVFKNKTNLGNSKDKTGYLDNLQCTNKNIKNFVEYIKEKDPSAIVVFFSDHGTDFSVDWVQDPEKWPEEVVEERMSNFIAIKLPQKCRAYLPDDLSNINIFPYIFKCLSGKDGAIKKNRCFATIYENTPYEGKFVEKPLPVK